MARRRAWPEVKKLANPARPVWSLLSRWCLPPVFVSFCLPFDDETRPPMYQVNATCPPCVFLRSRRHHLDVTFLIGSSPMVVTATLVTWKCNACTYAGNDDNLLAVRITLPYP